MSTAEIEITFGDIRVYEIRIEDEITGLPIDLDTGDLEVTARTHPTATEAVFVKTELDGIDVQDQITDTGLALMTVFPEDTEDLGNDWHTLSFDVRFIQSDLPKTPIRGVLRVLPSVGEGG